MEFFYTNQMLNPHIWPAKTVVVTSNMIDSPAAGTSVSSTESSSLSSASGSGLPLSRRWGSFPSAWPLPPSPPAAAIAPCRGSLLSGGRAFGRKAICSFWALLDSSYCTSWTSTSDASKISASEVLDRVLDGEGTLGVVGWDPPQIGPAPDNLRILCRRDSPAPCSPPCCCSCGCAGTSLWGGSLRVAIMWIYPWMLCRPISRKNGYQNCTF